MKRLLFSLLISLQVSAPRPLQFNGFINFVRKNFKVTESIRKNCDWQYAIVEVKTDVSNRVISYKLLNNAVKELEGSFNYLLGYQFNKNSSMGKRTIVFFYTIENHFENCTVPERNHKPTEATSAVLSVYQEQQKKEPNTIFIYEPIINILIPPIK